ncbi:MAG TPA: sigma-54 dependent transcriptional regulator [Steroidobacteraceae bacterium]|nr:sigma-54 dependent transcriptional regulator [Steroidobacteraceae bacterium]
MHVDDVIGIRHRASGAGIALVGDSPAFLGLLRSVDRVARAGSATVLIRGETGTGKELIARAVHYLGARSDAPFVPINCGALPDQLAENEFFGHRAGAFTGASGESLGLLRLAHRGTLFLDEVDSLPAKTQVALLRFLQDGSFRPLGAGREERVDVRIIAASNRDLDGEVKAGRFRADLFFRLNLIAIRVPSLRERAGDIRALSQYFLGECARRYCLADKQIDDQALRRLCAYAWPGNVRELENLIHRAYLLGDGERLDIALPGDAPDGLPEISCADSHDADDFPQDDASPQLCYRMAKLRALQEFDRTYLTRLLQRASGNVTRAAQLAGKERRALGKLLKRYGIERATDPGAAD